MSDSNNSQVGRAIELTVEPHVRKRLPWLPLALLAAVLFLHFSINFVDIGKRFFWYDESTTYEISKLPILEIAREVSHTHTQPPLFYWVAHIALSFGDSPAFLRSISFVFMAGALTFIMLGLKEISVSSRLVGALLLTFSPFTTYLSQEFRPYAMAVFFILISSVFLYRALIRGQHWRPAIAYGLAALGLLIQPYTKLLGFWLSDGCVQRNSFVSRQK